MYRLVPTTTEVTVARSNDAVPERRNPPLCAERTAGRAPSAQPANRQPSTARRANRAGYRIRRRYEGLFSQHQHSPTAFRVQRSHANCNAQSKFKEESLLASGARQSALALEPLSGSQGVRSPALMTAGAVVDGGMYGMYQWYMHSTCATKIQ